MTGAEFYNYVLSAFKRTDKSSDVYLAIADTVMDIRARILSDEHAEVAYIESGTLHIGDYKVPVPSDFGHLIGDVMIKDTESDTTYPPLKKISKQDYDRIYKDVLSENVNNRNTGTPVHFCYYGREIYFGPPVDKTTYQVTINYTTEDAPTYTAETAEIPFTEQFREVVRAGVLYRLYHLLEHEQTAANWKAVYDEGVCKIALNDQGNINDSVVGIQYHGI